MPSVSPFYKSKSTRLKIFGLFTLSIKTPRLLYACHRFLFRLTNGGWNDALSWYISRVSRKYPTISPAGSVLGQMSDADIEAVADGLNRDGCFIFDQRLSPETVERLTQLSQSTPVRYLKPADTYAVAYSEADYLLGEVKDKSARFQHDTAHLLASSAVQNIVFDGNILRIAQAYLGCKPILDIVTMGWSYPTKDQDRFTSAAAQKFHFDMDRIKFLKWFFYLTDVDERTGPHCFVKGSHRRLPAIFRKRGRFEDKDIVAHYKPEDILEICGKKGTIMAVDTRGLHKGKILEEGNRLIFALQFSNSLFGSTYKRAFFNDVVADKAEFIKNHYQSYFCFFGDVN